MSIVSNRWFGVVRTHLDAMLAYGRGQDCPLFGGVIDPQLQRVIVALSPPPPGVRMTDFNWCGNNFMHDLPLLEVMSALTQLTGDPRYDQAVDQMCDFFGAHAAHPDTGLFGWGEHCQWSFPDRQILPCTFTDGLASFRQHGYMVHDHLRCSPEWFWRRLWKFHPQAVVRFAHGLNGHIVDEKTYEHNRHAALTAAWWRDPKNPTFDAGKDFARHAGFHIIDCAFACRHSGERSLFDWIRGILGWHLRHRFPSGVIRGCVRTPDYEKEGQHDSLALSVDHAADILGRDTPEGRELADQAAELFDARRRQYLGAAPRVDWQPQDPQLWLAGYFRKRELPAPAQGNMLMLMHQRAGIPWYADQLVAQAAFCRDHLAEPPAAPLLAGTFAQYLELLLLAHQHTGDASLLVAAGRVAELACARLSHGDLLSGAAGFSLLGKVSNFEWHCDPWLSASAAPGYYYSVTGTPLLLRSLLQLALAEAGEPDLLGVDLHRR